MCRRCGLGLLPLLLVVLSLATFVITYVISFLRNDTSWFPAISDAADRRPESNVFGFLFNFCSVMGLVTAFVRYLQLRHVADRNERDRFDLFRLNKVALVLGIVSSLGASIVANFQEDAISVVHINVVLMVFGGGILYCWVQSYISYKMKTYGLITSTLFTVRLLIVIAMSIFFISCVTTTLLASKDRIMFRPASITASHQLDLKGKTHTNRVIGDVSEWLMALSLLGFMFTFFGEVCEDEDCSIQTIAKSCTTCNWDKLW